jgi:hypothetical protein
MTEVELALNALRRWTPLIVSLGALVLLPLLRERLRATFVTTETLDGLGTRIDADVHGMCKRVGAVEGSVADIDARLDAHAERITRQEEHDRYLTDTVARLIMEPLERVADRMENIAAIQAKQGETLAGAVASLVALTAAVAGLERRVDRADRRQ